MDGERLDDESPAGDRLTTYSFRLTVLGEWNPVEVTCEDRVGVV